MSAAHDYGFSPDAPQTNGNGGHAAKVFSLKPAADPDTLAILRSREAAMADPDLNAPEKAFLTFAFDRCLNPRHYAENFRKGIAAVADSIVAKIFGVKERTVWNWRHNVRKIAGRDVHGSAVRKYVWFSKFARPDKWAVTLYHLTCLHPAPAERTEWTDGGASYAGGAAARQAQCDPAAAASGREKRNAALAAKRAQGALPLQGGIAVVPAPVSPPPDGRKRGLRLPKSADFRRISADARNSVRLATEKLFGGQPKNSSADSRKTLRRTAEELFGSAPKNSSAHSRNGLPPSAEAGCEHKEPQIGEKRGSKEGGSPPAPEKTFLEAIKERFADLAPWLEGFNGAFRSKVEKSRERIAAQLRAAAANQRPLLKRKLAALDELLDGPAPPPPDAASVTRPAALAPARKPAGPVKSLPEVIAAMREATR